MLSRRRHSNTEMRSTSRNNKENHSNKQCGRDNKQALNDLENKASLKLQELSEVDGNIPDLFRTVPIKRSDWRYELSGWNQQRSEQRQEKLFRKDRRLVYDRINQTAQNSAKRYSYRSHSFGRNCNLERKSLQLREKIDIMPFGLTTDLDNPLVSREMNQTNQTVDISSGNFVSECIYPLHIFDEFSHTNEIDHIKLRILNSLKKQKSFANKTPNICYRKARSMRPMTSLPQRPQKPVDRVISSGLIRKHHAIRQMLKKKETQKSSASISSKYQSQNKFAQYLCEKFDAVVNKLGCAVLK